VTALDSSDIVLDDPDSLTDMCDPAAPS
jgi:hypothetical protein